MIEEDYVSFGIAKLLKEKGFDGECDHLYVNGDIIRAQGGKCNWNKGEAIFTDYKNECSAPTLQMAMKWLREKHDLHIEITSIKPYGSDGNGHDIPLDGVEYHTNIVQNNKWIDTIKKFKSQSIASYCSYEHACEAGIKYCLEKLI